ncbi:MAG TPA: hypothetical protein VMV18_14375, partial [bacterium]|nr:hypothetical protein [bacterium]
MRRVALIAAASVFVIVLSAACSKSKGGGGTPGATTVPATLHVVKGPTGAAAFAPAPTHAFAPSDGHWKVSPDAATLHLVSLSFAVDATGSGPGATVNLANCAPTYQRADASLTSILDCPFNAPVGKFRSFGVNIETTMEIMVNDSANGIFTDPGSANLLSTTAPAGGAQPVSVNFAPSQPSFGLNYPLATPMVIG